MEPVVGLDVSKGTSMIQAFLKRNEAYGKSESIRHTELGFRRLGEVLIELRERTEKNRLSFWRRQAIITVSWWRIWQQAESNISSSIRFCPNVRRAHNFER